ncbi:MAG: ATP-binding protein [Spirochaetales bacterium]|nr:ATP-binding protein [Spirochaetales bacterium]
MIRKIVYCDKAYKKIRLNISPGAKFNTILSTINRIDYPGTPVKSEHINYAILELINNSLRAHRERDEKDPVTVEFSVKPPNLHVDIIDRGGGFNPGKLPFSLSADPDTVDIHNEEFNVYRKQNDYKRFGMGFYIVKKTFQTFELSFYDGSGNPVPWEHGNVIGTRINLSLGELS